MIIIEPLPVKVGEISGERNVFLVASESGTETYRVDLERYPMRDKLTGESWFCGECECTDWKTRCQPAIRKLNLIAVCKHVVRAREYVLNRALTGATSKERK